MRVLWPRDAPSGRLSTLLLTTLLNNKSISKWFQNFRQHRNVLSKYPSARIPTVVKPENVDRARGFVEESLGHPTRLRGQSFEISRTSLGAIMKKHLMFQPYKSMIVQKSLRMTLFNVATSWRILNILQDDLAVIITLDEAHFHLHGHVNEGAIIRSNFYMKLNLKLRFTNFLVKYLAGFAEMILKVSEYSAFRLQIYETWFGLVIAP